MGWAAYEFERPNGQKLLVYVPKVQTPINMGLPKYSELTLSDLLKYPEFPIEAHIVTNEVNIANAKSFGFTHIINAAEIAGEVLSLGNGWTIEFNRNAGYEIIEPDGSQFTASSGASNIITWFPWIVGENRWTMEYSRTNMVSGSKVGIYMPGEFPDNTYIYPSGFYKDVEPIYITSDPYGDGGESETGGGTGDFDNTGDDVDIPGLPTLSATSAGFITLFNPSVTELNNLASYMWSDLFDINGWKKVFADPMQAILGLSIVPVNVPAATSKPVKVGNISTDVTMTVAASQYVSVDCGTLNVNEFWGAYLDYDPFTKAEIYLPYIGIHSLATDDIMGKAIHVVYHVDILSGSCCAYVKCGGSVLYSFVGQCSSSVPITGDNWTNVINGALSIAGSIGSMVATGGASAPSAIGNIASTAVNSMKPSIEKSGSMGGTGGMLGIQTPYLILTRPRQAVPRDQNKYIGYPSFITAKLSDLNGYTEIDSIHLENIGATEKELSEIENILKSGVIF